MSYFISIIPKNNSIIDETRFEARKHTVLKKLLPNKKLKSSANGSEVTVTYKDKRAAYTAAAKVRQHVHGATAKVFPTSILY